MNIKEQILVQNHGRVSVADLHQLAAQKWQAGDRAGAVDVLEHLLQEEPNNAWIAGEMGGLMIEMKRRGVGVALLTLACTLEKIKGVEDWRHWSTLGSALEALENRELAEDAFREAVRVDPEVSEIYDQWAGVYVNAGNPHRCIELARKSLALKPENNVAKKHLSLGLLEAGQWEEAWPLMEARKEISDYTRPKYEMPYWTGEKCETLIIHGEQGIGDELMYLSLIARIRWLARRMVVEVTPRLVPLVRRSLAQMDCEVYASIDEAKANGALEDVKVSDKLQEFSLNFIKIEGAPDAGYERPHIISCASLPNVLGLARSQARSDGYLLPDAARVNHWREKLLALANGRKIVGIAWEGGVRKTHKKVRNPPFALFQQFVAAHEADVLFVSVQYTHGETEIKRMPGIAHFQQAIDDLDEQAALVSACDLIVSVPQTLVHIAGAMAVPVLAIVSKCPRWDFCSADDRMPWWSSVTMIKQHADEWPAVFERMTDAFKRRLGLNVIQVKHETQASLSAAQ